MKVTVCGAAGGIGQPLSLLLQTQLPPGSVLALYDVVPVLVGVAEDLSHICTNVKLESYVGDMKNWDTEASDKALTGADVVVVPAGVPRKPGMTRDDLFKVNAGIVKGLMLSCAKNCPNAAIAIITNPVNSIVPVAAEILKSKGVYNPNKLFGISLLDVVRAQTFIANLKRVDPTKVKVHVVGGHSPETMLPVLSQVEGISFTSDEAKNLVERIKEAGTAVVNAKEGNGSATLSMAYAGCRFITNLIRALSGEPGIIEDSYVAVDKMDVAFCGVPVELGRQGVAKIHELPKFNEQEQTQFKELLPVLQKNIQTGIDYAHQ